MRHSTVICHHCGKTMVPRARYSRRLLGYAPSGNHCPFCLSENWDGSAPSLGMRLFRLLGIGLGILAFNVTADILFWLQRRVGISGEIEWLIVLIYVAAGYAGYRFYAWFVAWDGGK